MKPADSSAIFATFKKHHKRLVATLKRHSHLDALVVVCGAHEKSSKSRVRAFTMWYVGQEPQEALFCVSRKSVIILAELGVAQGLEFMSQITTESGYEVIFLKKSTKHNDNEDQIRYMMQHLQKEREEKHLQLAFPIREPQQGVLQNELDRYLRKHAEFCIQDAAPLLSTALQIKDKGEMQKLRHSGLLCAYLMKKFIYWVEQVIDKSEYVKHAHMSSRMDAYMKDTSQLQIMEHHCQLQGPFGLSYSPILQSGGKYDFSSEHLQSNHDILKSDCIIIQLGAKYFGYNTNCIRTILINPDQDIRVLYNVLLGCFQELVDKLKPGTKLRRVYSAVQSQWRASAPKQFLDKFPDCLGYGIGIEQRENILKLHHNARGIIHVGMCFQIRIAIEDLNFGDRKSRQNYALCVGDTICITESDESVILTNSVDRGFKKISFQYAVDEKLNPDLKGGFIRLRREQPTEDQGQTQLLLQLKHSQTYFQEISLKHQEFNQDALKQRKQFELEERVFGKQWPDQSIDKSMRMMEVESYKTYEPFPSSLEKGRFFIDTSTYSVLAPIRGMHIPFHVSTIKSVTLESRQVKTLKQEIKSCKQDPDAMLHIMRIHFWTSETSITTRIYPILQVGELFIKELSFMSDNLERLEDYALLINELQKQAKIKQNLKNEEKPINTDQLGILMIEPLILNLRGPKIVLYKMRVRPALSHCKGVDGALECHLNGFKYVSAKEEVIDITFKSVKHYIYQSPEQEIIAAIHLHLKGPLVIGKRRSTDVQFYREVPGALECLENQRKAQLTPLDLEFEKRVKKERQDMLSEIEHFVYEMERFSPEHPIKFERPLRHLAFDGSWNRARLYLQPAQSCIVNVVESPFFIVTLSELDIACFERIMVGVKTFDLVFVYKSYDKGWVRIESIDRTHLESVQQWLNQKNILYFSVTNTLMWKNMLFTITRDFKAFVHEGGWAKIMMEQVDHAPLHNYMDDGSSVFEPLSSEGVTSFSDEIPELMEEEQPKNIIYEEEDVSQIADSNDLLGLQEQVSDQSDNQLQDQWKLIKKTKLNYV